MTFPATARSTTRPHWLSLLTLTACLLAALTGSLTLGERATAANSAIVDVSAHQSSYNGVDTVYVSAHATSFILTSKGTFDLALTKLGRGSIGKVTIRKEGDYRSQSKALCGFAIPAINLSSGYWTISLRFRSDPDGIDSIAYNSIYVN